jgi:hypothetical protein
MHVFSAYLSLRKPGFTSDRVAVEGVLGAYGFTCITAANGARVW